MDYDQRYEAATYQQLSRDCYEAATAMIRYSLAEPLYGAYPNTPARWLPLWYSAAQYRARGSIWATKARRLLGAFPYNDFGKPTDCTNWEGRP